VAVISALIVAGTALTAPTNVEPLVPISGSGSTPSQGAVDQRRSETARDSGLTVNYSGTGSTDGRINIANAVTGFAAADLAFDSAAEGPLGIPAPLRDFAHVPAVTGATSLMHDPRIGGARLIDRNLSRSTVAGIFTGEITNRADIRISADNPGLSLPDLQTIPVIRADSSGSTAQFTGWVSAEYPEQWNAFCVSLRRACLCGPTSKHLLFGSAKALSGSSGVSGPVALAYGVGSITYVGNSYALRLGLLMD
jgi:phosphate transport system substrate-binding protein